MKGSNKKKRLLTEEEKRKKGLIKTPKTVLNRHFNYHYLFSTLEQTNGNPKKSPSKAVKVS